MKIIPTVELIGPRLAEFATACGESLARAHARSGDPVAIAAYLGKGDGFLEAMVAFAGRYADQNERRPRPAGRRHRRRRPSRVGRTEPGVPVAGTAHGWPVATVARCPHRVRLR